jgi:hypothetical protein
MLMKRRKSKMSKEVENEKKKLLEVKRGQKDKARVLS